MPMMKMGSQSEPDSMVIGPISMPCAISTIESEMARR